MYQDLFWLGKGIILGFGISMPVGPMGILCIQRTLKQGHLAGLLSGLGAATADMLYAMLAAFGLGMVGECLARYGYGIQVVGGILLLAFGARIFITAKDEGHKNSGKTQSLYGLYSSAFLLTFTNPVTIFMFTALFAGLGVNDPDFTRIEAAQLVAGAFMGSFLWYVTLSSTVGFFRGHVEKYLPWINRVAATALMIFGLMALLDAFGVINLRG